MRRAGRAFALASPITLHGHRRPRLYRGGRLARDGTACQDKSDVFLKSFHATVTLRPCFQCLYIALRRSIKYSRAIAATLSHHGIAQAIL